MDHPQSHLILIGKGYHFVPLTDVDWLDDILTDSFEDCAYQCHRNSLCRTVIYNEIPYRWYLFQVEPSIDQIQSQFSSSEVGFIELHLEFYVTFNQTCNHCVNDRYLFCRQGYCQRLVEYILKWKYM